MGRILNIIGALIGMAMASQFPEFSQQYVQRLGGAVDELQSIVMAFDETARVSGLDRETALEHLSGSSFLEGHQDDMRTTITRFERLASNYAMLQGSTAIGRVAQIQKFRDRQLLEKTWDDFEPAVPLNQDGAIFAGAGFLSGLLLFAAIGSIFRRRQ